MTALLLLASAAFAIEPIAHYDFEGADLAPEISGAATVDAIHGKGIRLTGAGGIEIPHADALRSSAGFAVELWVQFSDVSHNMAILAKPDEYQIRIDPAPEGANISFFVNVGGMLEPRSRGPRAEVGKWYHIIASWDGSHASLWVNGRQYRQKREGPLVSTENPLLIGLPQKWGPYGLEGIIDDVSIYNRPLTDAEILLAEYGLDADTPRGWQGILVDDFAEDRGRLAGTVSGHPSAFVRRGMDAPTAENTFASLRMSVSAGETGRLLFVADDGPGIVEFPLHADGEMHSYVLDLRDHAKWLGAMRSFALAPSDADASVRVDRLSFGASPRGLPEIEIESLLADQPIVRAGKPFGVTAVIHNTGGPADGYANPPFVQIETDDGLSIPFEQREQRISAGFGERQEFRWQATADKPGRHTVTLRAGLARTLGRFAENPAEVPLHLNVTPPVNLPSADYVPEPEVAESELLVGAHYCPLWKQGSRGSGWELIEPYPEREPGLGWYDEGSPEVADWEIKWALEHGIDYFVYCWYRTDQGNGRVDQFLGHAVHDGLFEARYGDQFKFTIMWENQQKGVAGISDEQDFLVVLLPWWIETYFKRDNYVKIDNKPLLYIYRPEFLVNDLGSVEAVKSALEKADQICREAGFDGLTLLGEYRGVNPKPLQLMVDEGLDYAFQYCWAIPGDPDDETAVATQEDYWRQWRELDVIPEIITISQGWDSTPWHGFTHSAWALQPESFERLCRSAKAHIETLPEGSLGRKTVLLDNWNEFGEGHYIAPTREFGFGYLDAIRNVFTDAPEEHVDLVPSDVGLGPYDSLYETFKTKRESARVYALTENLPAGVVGYWSFDEDDDAPIALDYSGNRQGGMLEGGTRVEGVRGKALLCDGGCVAIPPGIFAQPIDAMTVECWVKTDVPDQSDKWFVNSIYGNGGSGFRFGLSGGKLAFSIPQTPWSHHFLAPDPLPLDEWVHVAATYDGDMLRIYMAGAEVASLQRGGRIYAPTGPLTLGSYAQNHPAHFTGVLDEVLIYNRALTATEIAGE